MSTSLTALLLFALWTLLVVLFSVSWRVVEVLRGVPANSWSRGAERAAPGVVQRASHAHLNCLENLPVFGAIVLAAAVAGKTAVTDGLAMWVLYARVAQSVIHIIGTTHWLVMARATFFGAQVILFIYMIVGLL